MPARWRKSRSCGSFSTARSAGAGPTSDLDLTAGRAWRARRRPKGVSDGTTTAKLKTNPLNNSAEPPFAASLRGLHPNLAYRSCSTPIAPSYIRFDEPWRSFEVGNQVLISSHRPSPLLHRTTPSVDLKVFARAQRRSSKWAPFPA